MTDEYVHGPVPYWVVENARKCSFSFMCSRICDTLEPDETDSAACRFAMPNEPGSLPECHCADARIAVLRRVIKTAQRQLAEIEAEMDADREAENESEGNHELPDQSEKN